MSLMLLVTLFPWGSSALPLAPYLFSSLPLVSWWVQPSKFINLYSMLPALKRRVPKKKINFPVLDLSFHRFSHSTPAHSVLFPSPFSFSLNSCCPSPQPWKWVKMSEKLREDLERWQKGTRERDCEWGQWGFMAWESLVLTGENSMFHFIWLVISLVH